jgi:hypothetical protein
MPDHFNIPNIAIPTPERADQYCQDHEYYFLSPDNRSYTGKGHGQMLIEHKDLFGFTQKEIDYATDPLVVNVEELRDRSIHLATVAIERGWICILVNKIARAIPEIPLAVFWFYAETGEVYDRITAWLKFKNITSGIIRLRTIMMRSWDPPVQSVFAKAQFSRKGNKPTCPVCGYEIGQEELVARGVCPRCQTKLW